jgi:hypothetical protein
LGNQSDESEVEALAHVIKVLELTTNNSAGLIKVIELRLNNRMSQTLK